MRFPVRYIFSRSSTFLFLILLQLPTLAQSPFVYDLGFQKRIQSWEWTADVLFQYKQSDKRMLSVQNRFSSELFERGLIGDQWRDENTFAASFQQNVRSGISLISNLDTRLFSDDNTQVKFNKHLLSQALQWRPNSHFRIQPEAGWTIERAFGQQDQGPFTQIQLRLNDIDLGGYILDGDFNSNFRLFPDRKNQEHQFVSGWHKSFSEFAEDSLRLGYKFSESRYYIRPTNALEALGILTPRESVFIDEQFLTNQLNYRISSNGAISILSNVSNRSIRRNSDATGNEENKREEFTVDNQFQMIQTSLACS